MIPDRQFDRHRHWCLPGLFLALALLFSSSEAQALDIEKWRIQTSLYTHHFDDDPEHVDHTNLINVEAWRSDDWHAGFAWFDNSFGQPSQYLYVGKSWDLGQSGHWYGRVTGGLLHGYKEPYEDKIPLNGLGIAPAIVPAIGFQHRWFFAEAQLGGLAVMMFTAGVQFGHGKSGAENGK
jgi:hypothetical protein